MEPLGQSAIRLMPDPKPCRFDYGNASQPIARLGDALAAVSGTTVIGAGRNPDIACDLSSIDEPSIIDLPRERGGQSRAEALEAHQVMAFALRRHTGRRRFITFTLDCGDLRLHQRQSLDLPCDLPAQPFRQSSPVSRDQRRRLQALVARLDVDAANVLTKQPRL